MTTLSEIMRDGGVPGTPYAFCSAHRDGVAELGIRGPSLGVALAHADRDKVRAAYRRTRFLEDRKPLMHRWADFSVGQ